MIQNALDESCVKYCRHFNKMVVILPHISNSEQIAATTFAPSCCWWRNLMLLLMTFSLTKFYSDFVYIPNIYFDCICRNTTYISLSCCNILISLASQTEIFNNGYGSKCSACKISENIFPNSMRQKLKYVSVSSFSTMTYLSGFKENLAFVHGLLTDGESRRQFKIRIALS